jgi:hypothetical protein
MTDYPSQKQDKFVLRLPDGLRDRIKNKADSSGRSMNAEIVQLLEKEYPPPREGTHIDIAKVSRLIHEYEKTKDPRARSRLEKSLEALMVEEQSDILKFDEP